MRLKHTSDLGRLVWGPQKGPPLALSRGEQAVGAQGHYWQCQSETLRKVRVLTSSSQSKWHYFEEKRKSKTKAIDPEKPKNTYMEAKAAGPEAAAAAAAELRRVAAGALAVGDWADMQKRKKKVEQEWKWWCEKEVNNEKQPSFQTGRTYRCGKTLRIRQVRWRAVR